MYPCTPVHCRSDHLLVPNSLPLERSATFFDYVVIEGKRYFASRTVGWNKSSFVQVLIPSTPPITAYGEILEVFQFDQDFRQIGSPLWMARMRWFKPWTGECDTIWGNLYVVLPLT